MKPDFKHASETFIRLNPHLFAVGSVEARKPKPPQTRTLDGAAPQHRTRQGGVGYCVCLVAHLKRPMDSHDNLRASLKPLVDAIAATLGIDDGDGRIRWEYHQVTDSHQGVTVKITECREVEL